MKNRRINQIQPWFDKKEQKAVLNYLKSGGWLTEFEKTRKFERMIADYVGSKYCSVVNNGTISLTIALMALDIGNSDEVIVPDYTMIASANAVILAGAKPVFVDIDPENLCLDFELTKNAITKKTKAIMLITINGRYPDMEKFVSLCRKKNIFLIEDAAQSFGSKYNNKHLGTFGIIGSFSFSTPKIITTGQGGALVTNDKKLYERILKIKDFGRRKAGVDYHETMGYNFKFTDLQAVIGIEQMKKLEWRVNRKKEMLNLYKNLLKDVKEIEFIKTDLKDASPWFIDVMVPGSKRKKLIKFLGQKEIGARPFYPAIHTQPPYKWVKGRFPVSENISKRGLWLPSSSFLKNSDIKRICESIKEFFNE